MHSAVFVVLREVSMKRDREGEGIDAQAPTSKRRRLNTHFSLPSMEELTSNIEEYENNNSPQDAGEKNHSVYPVYPVYPVVYPYPVYQSPSQHNPISYFHTSIPRPSVRQDITNQQIPYRMPNNSRADIKKRLTDAYDIKGKFIFYKIMQLYRDLKAELDTDSLMIYSPLHNKNIDRIEKQAGVIGNKEVLHKCCADLKHLRKTMTSRINHTLSHRVGSENRLFVICNAFRHAEIGDYYTSLIQWKKRRKPPTPKNRVNKGKTVPQPSLFHKGSRSKPATLGVSLLQNHR